MSQSGFTPIQLYRSATPGAVPLAGNLAPGELAINTADQKLFFENASGTVVASVPFNTTGILGVANGGTGASTLTSGYLLKGNGASAVSSSVLYENGGYLGIGTTGPAVLFDAQQTLNGSGGISYTNLSTGASSAASITAEAGGSYLTLNVTRATGVVQFRGVTATTLNQDFTTQIFRSTGATEYMRITSAGDVGIGTSAPGTKLEVSIPASANPVALNGLRVNIAGLATNQFSARLYAATSGGGVPYAQLMGPQDGNGWLAFTSGGSDTERMRLDASGNLGIGTTAPGTKLEVSSTSAGATVEVLRLNNPGGGANTAAQIKFLAAGANYASVTGGYGAAAPQMTFNLPAGAGNYVWQNASVEQMRIDASGNLLVGATANPGVLNTSVVINSGANSLAGIVLQNNATGTGSTDGSNITIAATDLIISNAENAPIFFKTNNTERVRITAGGNVGIGTTAPTAQLAVVPPSNPTSPTGGLQAAIGEASNNAAYQLRMGYTSTYQGVINVITGGAGAELLLNPSGGAVGIGTSSPAAKLDVAGNVRIGTGSSFYWGDASTQIVGDNAGPMRFLTGSAAERMRIDSSGNVGIGTTAPTTGSMSNLATVNAGIFITTRGTVSAASGVATTIAVSAGANNVTYIVSCTVAASDPVNYSAVAIVSADASTLRVTTLQTANLMTISVSGTNIQATQASGAAQTIQFCITRVS